MSIYTDAIRMSREGCPQYIVSKSLDTVHVRDKASLLKFLKDGYTLQGKYVNGVCESSWRVDDKTVLQGIADICDLKTLSEAQFIQVKTQDFYDATDSAVEQTVMYLVIWKYGQKAETYWVTVKNSVSKPELFAALQEKANRIRDLLFIHGIKQDSESMIQMLEKKLKVVCMDSGCVMKIRDTDDTITVLAKKAAMISVYSIRNPLHVYFEDGNVTGDPMDFERMWNDIYREYNGERMHGFIGSFLDEFEPLSIEDRREVYRMYKDKESYLWGKWSKKLRNSVNPPIPTNEGLAYHKTIRQDGHIYFRVFSGPELLAF